MKTSVPHAGLLTSPARVLVFGFGGFITVGTLLLLLPAASAPGRSVSFIDALFTATSAVCVTGLVIKDISTDFSLFGQLVILFLIQIGGFGYMTVATLPVLLLGRKIGLKEQLALQEALNVWSLEGVPEFLRSLIKITLLVEGLGALALTGRFALDFPLPQALYLGVFHAVSAFNNAGFSLFPTNLMAYRDDLAINLIITTLIILGGLGFLVHRDLSHRRISFHTKLVLIITASLIVGGTLLFLVVETHNNRVFASLSWPQRLLVSYFHAVAARTAGFNTVDLAQLSGVTLYILIILMFIGASPGGTGGGIKTSTFGTIMLDLWTSLRGQVEVTVFHRRVPAETVAKAYLIAALAFFWLTGATVTLLALEQKDFLRLLFEVASALGTVGLSTGDGGILSFSALFSDLGKIVIALTMFVGRVGPMTLGMAVLKSHYHARVRYPESTIVIG
ncbi:MAG: TrkH family potassium uptake protein [Candidatus Bipolaricaulia bacterium]